MAPVVTVEHGPNAANQRDKPYVVLLSLDGFRYDYVSRYGATHLQAIAARGATAPEGMIPSYPSVTFANHVTLVTGLYPEHHGIVGNSFYDPARHETYLYSDSTARDSSWYGGTPLWVLAEQHGMRTASLSWPGNEAAVRGVRSTYTAKFDQTTSNAARVAQIIAWLRLPAADRPHLITAYMFTVDEAGHESGPNGSKTIDAVHEVDSAVGALDSAIQTLHLPVDLIVLSDHGMAALQGDWVVLARDEPDLRSRLVKAVGTAIYAKTDSDADHIVTTLRAAHNDKYLVYRRADLPPGLHDNENPRSGDPMIVATGAYPLRLTEPPTPVEPPDPGGHGFDPARVPDVKASFFAAGPQIRRGVTVAPFQNVDIYPFVARILQLDAGTTDGSLRVLGAVLAR